MVPKKPNCNRLGNVGQVQVDVLHAFFVDLAPHGGTALVGCAPGHGIGQGQFLVDDLTAGCTGEHPNLEGAPGRMFAASAGRQGMGDHLAAPAGVKPLKEIVSPCFSPATAASGVKMGKPLISGMGPRWIECGA